MPVDITLPDDGTIHIKDLRDGQIAVITCWGNNPGQIGAPVQRIGDDLVCVGLDIDHTIKGVFAGHTSYARNYRVRVAPNGTTLTVRGNE